MNDFLDDCSGGLDANDIADLVSAELKAFSFYKEIDNHISANSAKLIGIAPIEYPYICYAVSEQTERACKLTANSDLPIGIRDIYLIDAGLQNLYATSQTLLIGVQAAIYSKNGKSGIATVSGMSAMRFSTTRPATPSSQHNFGKAFDLKLQGKMKSNGASYDQLACAYLCTYCVEAGATRVFFSDQAVVDAVNKATGKNICSNIAGHENHIHMDCR